MHYFVWQMLLFDCFDFSYWKWFLGQVSINTSMPNAIHACKAPRGFTLGIDSQNEMTDEVHVIVHFGHAIYILNLSILWVVTSK